MMNSGERGLAAILDVFIDSQLFPPDQIKIMEDYFDGKTDAVSLGKLEEQNLRAEAGVLMGELRWLLKNGMNEEAVRAANVYFAAGGAYACYCYPEDIYSEDCCVFAKEPEKRVTLFATYISKQEDRMREPYLKRLMDMAHNDPEIVKKAYELKEKGVESCIILLTVYFLLKYPGINPEDRVDEFSEVLDRQGCPEQEAAEETALMRRYEDLFIDNIDEVYTHNHNFLHKDIRPEKEKMDEIKAAIRNGRIDDNILKLAAIEDSQRNTNGEYIDGYWRCCMGMAFINFSLSARLKDVLTICFAARTNEMIFAISGLDMRGDLDKIGGRLDEIFGLDAKILMCCAAALGKENILKEQFRRNREAYLACMDDGNVEYYAYMSGIIKQEDPAFYREWEHIELARQQEELMNVFTRYMKPQTAERVKKYLSGEADVKELYDMAKGKDIFEDRPNRSARHLEPMNHYREAYGYDALCKRCEAALMAYVGFNGDQFRDYLLEDEQLKPERVREFFRAMEEENITLSSQLNGFLSICNDTVYHSKKMYQTLMSVGKEIFSAYLEKHHDEMVEEFKKTDVNGRIFGVQVLSLNAKRYMDDLVFYAGDKAEVKNALVEGLCRAKDCEEEVIGLLSSDKAAERELAVKVLAQWKVDEGQSMDEKQSKYTSLLMDTLAKEKSVKVRTLLESVLPAEAVKQPEEKNDLPDIVKELHRGNKKRSLAWAYDTPFPKVHKKDASVADEEYLQAILLAYSAMSLKDGIALERIFEDGMSSKDSILMEDDAVREGSIAAEKGMASYNVCPVAAALALALEEKEFAVYAEELLDRWMAAGADSRKRWVLYVAAIHGNSDMPEKLGQLVREWASKGSYTIAVEALRAMALSLRPKALEIVGGISRKFSPARIKAAAGKALRTAAAWAQTTREGLLDRTVPDLGFDERAQRCFDYGERKFTVKITANFELEAFDEKGKKLKSLPMPGKQDDEAKAAAAYEEFKQLKKLLKTVAAFQTMRMETALSDGRVWSIKAWKELFLKNPIMHQFAISLIWGIYEDGELVTSFHYLEDGFQLLPQRRRVTNFRCREDGSFYVENTEETHPLDEANPQEGRVIKLVHPVELTLASQNAWEEQLEANEIKQPVEQLERWEYYVKNEEEGQKSLDRFKGCTVNAEDLRKSFKKLGWEYDVEDYEFGTCFKENEELSMGVVVTFTVDMDHYEVYENTTIGEVKFYKLENGELPDEDDACLLDDVPERYFSEIVLQLEEMTESE